MSEYYDCPNCERECHIEVGDCELATKDQAVVECEYCGRSLLIERVSYLVASEVS